MTKDVTYCRDKPRNRITRQLVLQHEGVGVGRERGWSGDKVA